MNPDAPVTTTRIICLCSRGPTPARSRSAARLRRATLRRLARAAGAFTAHGAPPPLALARRRGFAALPSGASLGPQARSLLTGPHPRSLSLGGAASPRYPPAPRSGRRRVHCSRGPTPARSRSAARLRRATLPRLARAAGAFTAHRAPPPLALAPRRGLAALP